MFLQVTPSNHFFARSVGQPVWLPISQQNCPENLLENLVTDVMDQAVQGGPTEFHSGN